jgi:excisionase family DNA binding protein
MPRDMRGHMRLMADHLLQLRMVSCLTTHCMLLPAKSARTASTRQVAAYRLSRSTIYKLIAAGTLRTVKIGGRRLIPRDALEALLNEDAQ